MQEKVQKEDKAAIFDWRSGRDIASLRVRSYGKEHDLAIDLYYDTRTPYGNIFARPPYWKYLDSVTIDLRCQFPEGFDLHPNEQFLARDIVQDLLRFLEENQLGHLSEREIPFNADGHPLFEFDLERLAKFDSRGVADYLRSRQQIERFNFSV